MKLQEQMDRVIEQFKKLQPSEESVKKQHKAGKLTARERIELLTDRDTFEEIDYFMESIPLKFGKEDVHRRQSVITGSAFIEGRRVFLYAHDFTVEGGSVGEREARKICKVQDIALQNGKPFIGINDSAGARIKEGVRNFTYTNVFVRNVMASGVIPQIFAIVGPCAGGAVYSPALGDFIFMVDEIGQMFLTGPAVIKAVTGETVTKNDLGGSNVHTRISGVAHFYTKSETDCFEGIKRLLSYIPDSNRDKPPYKDLGDDPNRREEGLLHILPEEPQKYYDMLEIIRLVVDRSEFLEVQSRFARNIVVGFARLGGMSIGLVASQPKFLAGCLDVDASIKAAQFIRFCDAFGIPIISLVDVPGYLPGKDQEYYGIIRHGAKMLYAFMEATVPKITLIIRKAYGGGIAGMNCNKERSADELLAWPSAEIAAVGPEGAVDLFYEEEIKAAQDPERRREELIRDFRENVTSPYSLAALGRIEKIIDPRDTRKELYRALMKHKDKVEARLPWRKHGLIPL
jgi:acetyl-CoA carboxylase carboxyltransferase component